MSLMHLKMKISKWPLKDTKMVWNIHTQQRTSFDVANKMSHHSFQLEITIKNQKSFFSLRSQLAAFLFSLIFYAIFSYFSFVFFKINVMLISSMSAKRFLFKDIIDDLKKKKEKTEKVIRSVYPTKGQFRPLPKSLLRRLLRPFCQILTQMCCC